MMKVGFRFAALAIALAALTCGTTQAALLWYDGFEIDDSDPGNPTTYVSGELTGQDGGTGSYFTGTWAGGNDPDGEANHLEAGSLTTPGQQPAPTGDKAGDGPPVFGGCCHMARSGRPYAADTIGHDGTIWMSFFANFGTANGKVDANGPQMRMVEWWGGGGMGDGALRLQLGFNSFNPNIEANLGHPAAMAFIVTGIDEFLGSNEPHYLPVGMKFNQQQGRTHAVALRFDFTTDDIEGGGTVGDAVSLYLNPTDLSDPGTPVASISNIDLHIDRMSVMSMFHFIGGQANPGAFDELRVGTTWADVAIAVPEPASCALIGLGLIGMVASARRKRS